jgi:alanine racemase
LPDPGYSAVWDTERVQSSVAIIDLAAIRSNVSRLKAATPAAVMAVVKADAYGHGLVPSAQAAIAGGASWLGVAKLDEALALRAAGITTRTLAWLWTPGDRDALQQAIVAGVDIGVSSAGALQAVRAATAATGSTARVHLKIDTGLSRNGVHIADWSEIVASAAKAEAGDELVVTGIWSHFVWADEPEHPTNAQQLANFRDAVAVAERAGLSPEVRHLANSAATLTRPETHFDLVRPGVAVYGLTPVPALGDFDLIPAMRVQAELANVKTVEAGTGISYGHAYRTTSPATLALVPLGYADGIPRAATNVGPVSINSHRFTISGRVCMDQFVVDVGNVPVAEGDVAVLFGSGRDGEPLAQDWADALDTIHYEIVTRIGPRIARSYVGQQR